MKRLIDRTRKLLFWIILDSCQVLFPMIAKETTQQLFLKEDGSNSLYLMEMKPLIWNFSKIPNIMNNSRNPLMKKLRMNMDLFLFLMKYTFSFRLTKMLFMFWVQDIMILPKPLKILILMRFNLSRKEKKDIQVVWKILVHSKKDSVGNWF